MPKKKQPETPEEQSERFRTEVTRMVDAGELNLIEAEERFEQAIRVVALAKQIGSIANDQ